MSREMLLNGRFIPEAEAGLSVVDRGVQFSESVYEVIRVYGGRPFEMERHLKRFRLSTAGINVDLGSGIEELGKQALQLLDRCGDSEALIYLQVTSGATPRSHLRPQGLQPTVIAMIMPTQAVPTPWRPRAITAITVPDERWARCNIKTTMLLVNTMAKGRAIEEGCDDAIFVRDGYLTEATAANVVAVFDGVICTPPKTNYILHGITREVLLEIAADLDIPVFEEAIPSQRLYKADELLMTATASEVTSVTHLDGRAIGSGKVGPVAERLMQGFQRRALGQ